MARSFRGRRGQDVADRHELAGDVGYLDADGRAPRDRRLEAHVLGAEGVLDLLAKPGDLVDLDALAQLDLVAGDRGAGRDADERGVDAELAQRRLQPGA